MLRRNVADTPGVGIGASSHAMTATPSPVDAASIQDPVPIPIVRGVGLGFLSFGVFSCGDACIKALGGRLSIFEILFFATFFGLVALPFVRQSSERWRDILVIDRPGLVMLRIVAAVLGGMLGVFAFTTLPFAEVYALAFLAPLFVTMLSIPFLGETVGWRRGLAILVGFAGVLLVTRPGFRELMPGHLAAVGIALCGATNVLVLRALGPTEKRITLMGVVFFGSLAVNGTIMLFDFLMPTPREFLLMALAGLCGGTGHILIMAATRAAPANRVAPARTARSSGQSGSARYSLASFPTPSLAPVSRW